MSVSPGSISPVSDGDKQRATKVYFCRRCLNHGLEIPKKGHACHRAHCSCKDCVLLAERRQLMAERKVLDDFEVEVNVDTCSEEPQHVMRENKRNCRLFCKFCKNHDVDSPYVKGHKRKCKFQKCLCRRCKTDRLKNKNMAEQMRLRRRQQRDRERQRQMREHQGLLLQQYQQHLPFPLLQPKTDVKLALPMRPPFCLPGLLPRPSLDLLNGPLSEGASAGVRGMSAGLFPADSGLFLPFPYVSPFLLRAQPETSAEAPLRSLPAPVCCVQEWLQDTQNANPAGIGGAPPRQDEVRDVATPPALPKGQMLQLMCHLPTIPSS